jgi:hypothetical protein
MSPLINLAHQRWPERPAPVVQWLHSPDFVKTVLDINDNSITRAQLSLHLLKHVALDARHGITADAFQYEGDGKITFILHLHRLHNFIGSFTLDSKSALCEEVQDAIATNLASRMFKAAHLIQRMLNPAHGKRFYYNAKRLAELRVEQEDAARLLSEPLAQPLSNGSRACHATQIASSMYDAYRIRTYERVHKVSAHACDSLIGRDAYNGMLAFALRYIAPEHLRTA